MGKLHHFDLRGMLDTYHCRVFIETGTGAGDSLLHAASFGFERLFSSEIFPEIADHARVRLASVPQAQILTATSEDVLKTVLPMIPAEVPVMYWLDAHFPGADYHLAKYGDHADYNIRLPLEREMSLIRELRPRSRDVILVDDLRIYEDGPFAGGNMPDHAQTLAFYDRNIDFAFRLFRHTHTIARDYGDEGYLVITPR
ncbi:hypothetical protein [Nitrospirillum pindoramense]|uniref:Class I SAM-dependent methyltransferase n=1 Tax=Nitrospirillum amazonense TaxID=28077 RepID=A0A560GTT0_9PROT|nr:hypothetical protein [Nitrospirillum amazonense]TWB37191.1 hypothetical protein FBZ90_1154 [Nitrospirillum amazonense]